MPSDDQRVGLKHPGLMLKYSTFKNLASMAASRDDLETAMEFYLEVEQYNSASLLSLGMAPNKTKKMRLLNSSA